MNATLLHPQIVSYISKGSAFWFLIFINTRRYSPLRGPTSSSGRRQTPSAEAFFFFFAKKELFMQFGPFLAIFGVLANNE